MSRETRRHPGLRRRIAIVIVGIAVLLNLGYLITRNHLAQRDLRRGALDQLASDTRQTAASVGRFCSERVRDLEILADRRVMTVYFERLALGMSLKSGLRDSLEDIDQRFRHHVAEERIEDEPIYARLVILDREGVPFVDTLARGDAEPPPGDLTRYLTPGETEPRIFTERGDDRDLVVSAPYRFRGEYSGQIVAWLNPKMLGESLFRPGGRHEFTGLVDASGDPVSETAQVAGHAVAIVHALGPLEHGPIHRRRVTCPDRGELDLLALRIPVEGTPLSLVRIRRAETVLGATSPAQLLAVLGIFSVVVIGAAGVVLRMLARNLRLEARYAEAKRRSGEIRAQHFELEHEMRERRQAEEALRESEEKYRNLAEMLPQVIFELDREGRVTFVNGRVFELFGYGEKDMASGLRATDMLAPEDRPEAEKQMRLVLSGEDVGPREFTAQRADGSTFPVLLRSTPIIQRGRPVGIRGFMVDVSRMKRLELQFHQAQKMESIGTLAGGIAHDFNNLLMGIQGRASLVLAALPEDEDAGVHLRSIEECVRSATQLTQQLLGFARGGRYEVQPTDLNDLVRRQCRMFGRTKKEVGIHRSLARDLHPVEVDRGQIEQVLLNLFVNAWQAMPGGGDLFVETASVVLELDDVVAHDTPPGAYVRVTVTDTGHGMDETTRRRVFEPFFTTKEMGRGTGLGLASVFGIIANHGGVIEVESVPEHGTTFTIHLPASMQAIEAPEKRSDRLQTGLETVLLVDDEEMIRAVGRDMLQTLGYTVRTAASGSEAVEIVCRESKEIALVVLDLIMPDLGGGETFDRLREVAPAIRVLLSSGYSIDGASREILDRGCNGFIQKPFTLQVLSRKVRDVLDGEVAVAPAARARDGS